jgi:hypothetical protein
MIWVCCHIFRLPVRRWGKDCLDVRALTSAAPSWIPPLPPLLPSLGCHDGVPNFYFPESPPHSSFTNPSSLFHFPQLTVVFYVAPQCIQQQGRDHFHWRSLERRRGSFVPLEWTKKKSRDCVCARGEGVWGGARPAARRRNPLYHTTSPVTTEKRTS